MSLLPMLSTVLRNLFSRPFTVRYPFEKRAFPAGSRGSIVIDLPLCIYCGMCQKKCPTSALVVDRKERFWRIDRLRCITCGYCVDVCPKKCLRLDTQYSAPVRARGAETFRAPAPVDPVPLPPKPAAPPK